MSFSPRNFEQILDDMIAYVQVNTTLSDFTTGSVIRTILEAAALEDDEQYFQMTQLLDAFRLSTARGEELDRRLADFGLVRRQATTATCKVRFFDSNLVTDQLATAAASGSVTIQLFDTSIFPTTGFPYTVRIGEGTISVQTLTVTANTVSTNTLTVTTLTDTHDIGTRVSMVTGSSSRVINSGTTVQAPATVTQAARQYMTQEPAFIIAGNFYSNEVLVKCQTTGTLGRVGANRITQFSSGAPFSGAGVINLVPATGGSDREDDASFRERALLVLQSISRGTPLALQTAAIGIEDPATGQRTVSANIIEDFVNDEVLVYIDDGSGLTPDTESWAVDSLSTGGGTLAIGSTTISLVDSSSFPSSGYILIDKDTTHSAELVEIVSKDDSLNSLYVASPTTILHDDGSTVLSVDVVTLSAESGRRRFRLQNPPVVRGTDRIFIDPGTGMYELTPDTDYVLNKGTGEFQFVSLAGADAGAIIVASYNYYTNLISQVQKVLEGDIDDPSTYPGVKAAGIFLSVEAPTIRRITVIASISAKRGFIEADIAPLVQTQIESYISSRRIGDDVVLSKIIDVAHNVKGLEDIFISTPSSNVTILENELASPYAADGSSLVTIL